MSISSSSPAAVGSLIPETQTLRLRGGADGKVEYAEQNAEQNTEQNTEQSPGHNTVQNAVQNAEQNAPFCGPNPGDEFDSSDTGAPGRQLPDTIYVPQDIKSVPEAVEVKSTFYRCCKL
jgi:hypothetical protein